MVSPIGQSSVSTLLTSISAKSAQLEDYSVQLSTGRSSSTYSGYSEDVGEILSLRNEISEVEGYQSNIDLAYTQLEVTSEALSRVVEISSEVVDAADSTEYYLTSSGQTTGQTTTETVLKEMLGLLDTEIDGDYIFSGTSTDTEPTIGYDEMMYGVNGADGLVTVTDERIRADAGSDGMGRLDLSSSSSTVTLAEEATEYGYKLDTVSCTLSNVTVTGPSGDPSSLDIEVTDTPESGEVLSVTFTLPDGSSEVITLTATTDDTDVGDGYFSINGSTDTIAAAIEEELQAQIEENVSQEGEAASRIQAALDFFVGDEDGNPIRVVGDPAETATTSGTDDVAGTTTVSWYVGEDSDSTSDRDTATVEVSDGTTVSYGARANEEGLAETLAYLAAFTLPTYDEDDEEDQAKYAAMADAIAGGLTDLEDDGGVTSISKEIAMAGTMMESAEDRNDTTLATLETLSDELEGIDSEEVAAYIKTLESTIEASYTVAADLYELTLANYI